MNDQVSELARQVAALRAFVQHVADFCPDEPLGDDARAVLKETAP